MLHRDLPDLDPDMTEEAFEAIQAEARLAEALAKCESLEADLVEARLAAHVLAHSWDHDSRPPESALDVARRFTATGGRR